MKKLLFLLVLSLSISFTLSAQTESKFVGVYGEKSESGSGGSGARLYIFPDGLYSLIYYGGTQNGSWEEYLNEYIIIKPDTNTIEKFYVFALYNEKIKGTSVQFDDFSSSRAVYSFNNGEKDIVMHPVYNPSPNCVSYPQITTFAKGECSQIQLAQLPHFEGKYFNTDPSEIQYKVYTFSFDPQYNDFKILLNKNSEESTIPFILALENKRLYMPNFDFNYLGSLEQETKNNLNLAKEIAANKEQPFQSNHFGENDEHGNWIETEYPRIKHIKKEFKHIIFDKENLFTATCDGTTEAEMQLDEAAVSVEVIE